MMAQGYSTYYNGGYDVVLADYTGARIFLGLPGDDDASGIATIENKQQKADNVWYDLNGRRVNAHMKKGI